MTVDQAFLANAATNFRRRLLTVEALMIISDSTEDEILEAIESGALPFAFDVRSDKARRRRCVRIYSGGATDFKGVFAAVFPGQAEIIPASRIARRLVCSSQHVHDLLREGSLRRRPGRLGLKESPPVYRRSIAEFLESRRVR